MDASAPPVVDATTPPVDASAPDVAVAPPMEAAAPVEAAAPEASVEAGVQAVTVKILSHLGPEPGVLIVFQDAAGNVVTTGTTDALGQVTQVVQAGGQVTAVMGSGTMIAPIVVGGGITVDDQPIAPPSDVQLVTVEGVKPGDVLSLVDPSDTTFSGAQVTIDSLPDAGVPALTGGFEAQIGNCYQYFSSPPVTVNLTPDCESNGQFPVLVIAQGTQTNNYQDTGYTYQTGNVLALDGGATHVSIGTPWSTAATNSNLFISDIPGTGYVQGVYTQVADGVAYPYVNSTEPDADGGAVIGFPGYPGYADFAQSEVDLTAAYTSDFDEISAIATRSADGGAVSVDLATALPYITTVTLDAGQGGDPDAGLPVQPSVAWGSDAGSLSGVDGVIVQLTWDDTNMNGTWTILAPPTATSVTTPTLPPTVAGWGPALTSSIFSPPLVVAMQASFLTGYDQLRSQFATIPATTALVTGQTYSGGSVPPLPVPGTVRLTAVTINND